MHICWDEGITSDASTCLAILCMIRYTLLGDAPQSFKLASSLHARLSHAKEVGGLVLASPTAVKSLFLTYIEITGKSKYEPALLGTADMLGSCLRLMKSGVATLDEVDLLLHPLKSELNFPVGKIHMGVRLLFVAFFGK